MKQKLKKLKKLSTLEFYLDSAAGFLRFFIHRNPLVALIWGWKNIEALVYKQKKFDHQRSLSEYTKSFNQKHPYFSAFTSMLLIVSLLAGSFWFAFVRSPKAQAGWWDDTWMYRKKIEVSNTSGSTLTNFQIHILDNVNLSADINAGKIQSSLNDLRFTDKNGNLLPYWFEDTTATSVDVWVKTTSIPTTGATFYMYYGNQQAASKKAKIGTQDFPGLSCRLIKSNGDGSTNGIYWVDFTNGDSADKQQVYCDMTNDGGGWMLATDSMVQSESNTATTTTKTADSNGGLILSVTSTTPPTSCSGNHTQQVLFKDNIPWNKIRSDYEFNGAFSCWSIFGNTTYQGSNLIPFASGTDTIRNQVRMGGSAGDNYDGINTRCDNDTLNFWHSINGTSARSAQVILRRNSMSSYAGLGAGGNCMGTAAGWKYQNIYLREDTLPYSYITISFGSEEKSSGPVGYWKFDEGYGAVATNGKWQKNGTTTNLITNPSFETNANSWSFYTYGGGVGTGAVAQDKAMFGGSSYKITDTGATGEVAVGYSGLSFTTGQTYTISAWIYSTTTRASIQGHFGGGWSTDAFTISVPAGKLNQWVRVTKTAVAGGTTPVLRCGAFAAGSAGTIYCDGIQVEQASTDSLYCDGSLIGNGSHAWNGTAHGSTSTCDLGTDGTLGSASGTDAGIPTWTSEDKCVSGKCLEFDGTDDAVDLGDYDDLKNLQFDTGDWAAFSWVKAGSGSTKRVVFGLRTGSDHDINYGIASDNMPYMEWVDYPSQSSYVTTKGTTAITDNKWHQMGIKRESGTLKLFVDGKQAASDATMTTHDVTGNNWFSRWTVGAWFNGCCTTFDAGVWQNFFKGFIDEVKVYNYARTDAQIKADYNAGLAGIGSSEGIGQAAGESSDKWMTDGLLGYWKMDEASGNCSDSSGSGITGTANGTTVTSGRFGNGRQFNGTSDNVAINYTNPVTATTVVAWFKRTGSPNGGYHIITGGGNVEISIPDPGGQIRTGVTTATMGRQVFNSGSGLIDGNWHQVALTYDGTNLKSFIDGAQTASNAVSGNLSGTVGEIGRYLSNSYVANGVIDEVRIYNRALSNKEINGLYNWAPGPSGWWKMDEGNGYSAFDASGGGNHGILTNMDASTDWVPGKYGHALDFDGSNDDLVLNSTITPGNGNWTISSWVKTTSNGTIMSNNSGGPVTSDMKILSGKITFSNYNSGWFDHSGTTTVNDGNWHYLTWVNYSNQTMNMYVDGKLESGGGFSSTTGNGGPVNSIGRNWNTTLNGKIDDVKYYNYARAQDQIVEDMNAGHPLGGSPIGSQLAYWKFDEGQGGTVYDQLGKHNGTISGATWTNDGRFGKTLNFDGVDDYVGMGTGNDYFPLNSFTICSWVKTPGLATGMSKNGIVSMTYGLSLYLTTTGQIGTNMDDGTNILSYTAGDNLYDNKWHHVCVAYDGANQHIYSDGVEKGVVARTWLGTTRWPTNSVNVGHENNNPAVYKFNGQIDEIKIYSSALTQDEIKIDMNQGKSEAIGSLGTDATGLPSNSADRVYCPPGDTTASCGPIAEWKLDDMTGATAKDTGGSNRNLSFTNSPTWYATGKVGAALDFDNDDYASNDWTDFSLVNQTVEFWMNADTITTGWRDLVGTTLNTDSSRFHMDTSDNTIKWYHYIGGTSDLDSNVVPTAGQWYHVAGTYDGTTARIYINGQLKNSAAASIASYTATGLMVGGTTEDYDGKIDDVRIYDYARTPSQIAYDYNRGKPVGWWKMDECEGSTIYDHSGNGNNGTLALGSNDQTSAGTCSTSANTAWYNGRDGKFNASLKFDGQDDVVDLGTNSSIRQASDMTVSAWVKINSLPSGGTQYSIMGRQYDWQLQITQAPVKPVFRRWTAYQAVTGNSTLQLGTWYNITAVLSSDASNNLKIYVNGVLDNQGTITVPLNSNAVSTKISGYIQSDIWWFDGQVDDARIYNYALTAEQVKQVVNDGAFRYGP